MPLQHGLPDAAAALVTACKEADLPLQQHNLETGELANLWEPVSGRGSTGSSGVPRYSACEGAGWAPCVAGGWCA